MDALILWAYSALLFCLQPLGQIYLLWRARKQPEYARHWGERFAFYFKKRIAPASRRVWVHAVSLGETRAALPLIEALYAAEPDVHVILTHTTPTGRAAGQSLFATQLADGRMTQVYVPYDLYTAVARFFRTFAPTDVWVMETEVWPNMVAAANRRGVRISLVNGRLSDKSLKQTLKLSRLMGAAYRGFYRICAQTEADAARYVQAGAAAAQLVVTGNLKFDMKAPVDQVDQGLLLKQLLGGRSVVVLSSTREGEEALWLASLPLSNPAFPRDIQWWVVPRHPQRFDDVERLLTDAGFLGERLVRKSELDALPEAARQACMQAAQVVLGDTMGHMFEYYALADVVMMGGAWMPFGGQNFLEPLSIGKPTVIGAHTYNFAQAAADAQAAGALVQCEDMPQGLEAAANLLAHEAMYTQQQARAIDFCAMHQGAVAKTLRCLL